MIATNYEPIDIVRVIRPMRGGSQAHLVEGHDGLFYVTKFRNNPQGTRTLVNEWFTHQLLSQFGISTPLLRVLCLRPSVAKGLALALGQECVASEPGMHIGSQCPVHPEKNTIYDFLPRPLLPRVVNRGDFARMLVVDLFLGQSDTRQAIFVRSGAGCNRPMHAFMIDHGGMFGGRFWQFPEPARLSFYFARAVYSFGDGKECETTLQKVSALPDSDLWHIAESVPAVWLSSQDATDWSQLLRQLCSRKNQLRRTWAACLPNGFANNTKLWDDQAARWEFFPKTR